MSRNSVQVSRRMRLSLYLVLGLLFLSGVLWLLLDNFVSVKNSLGLSEKHYSQSWMLTFHGIMSYPFLLLFGAMLANHVVVGWKSKRYRFSGVSMVFFLSLLSLSALALYYSGSEDGRRYCSYLHIALGLLLPMIIAWHVTEKIRMSRKRLQTTWEAD